MLPYPNKENAYNYYSKSFISHNFQPLLKWVLNYLVEVISDQNATDYAVASTLHSIEILISDNNLQCPTLPFVSDIIIRCIELFARPSWIVR